MDLEATEKALAMVKGGDVPLFNATTVLAEASLDKLGPCRCKMLLGDECGGIEVVLCKLPERRLGMDYSLERLGLRKLHTSAVTCIVAAPRMELYLSGSVNGRIVLFHTETGKIVATKTIEDHQPLSGFALLERDHTLAMIGPGRAPSAWSTEPWQRSQNLAGTFCGSIGVTPYLTANGRRYFALMTEHRELRLYDSDTLKLAGEFDVRDKRDVCFAEPYSFLGYDTTHNLLFSGAKIPIRMEENIRDGPRGRTHVRPIVGLCESRDLKALISVDSAGNVASWDWRTGKLVEVRAVHCGDIVGAVLDVTGRHLFTLGEDDAVCSWNPASGGAITSFPVGEKGLTQLRYAKIGIQNCICVGGWSHCVKIMREVSPEEVEVGWRFSGLKGDVTALAFGPGNNRLFAGTSTGQIWGWALALSNHPQEADIGVMVEAMEAVDSLLVVGDTNGLFMVFKAKDLSNPVRMNSRRSPSRIAVSAMSSCGNRLVWGDTGGFIGRGQVT
jgi:WD40 repeat protein